MNKFEQVASDDYQMSVAGDTGPMSDVWGRGQCQVGPVQ